MNSQNILYSLQKGEITQEQAKTLLLELKKDKANSLAHEKNNIPGENIMLIPIWDAISEKYNKTEIDKNDTVVIIGGTEEEHKEILDLYPKAVILKVKRNDNIEIISKKINKVPDIRHIIRIIPFEKIKNTADEKLVEIQEDGVIGLFRIIKALLELGYGAKDLKWTVMTRGVHKINEDELINPAHAAIEGLFGSMAKEYLNWNVRLVDLPEKESPGFKNIFELPFNPAGNPVAYRNEEWYTQKIVPVKLPKDGGRRHPASIERQQNTAETRYRKEGVYVIIGGAGGIGGVLSEYLIRNFDAKIVWIGRRAVDDDIQSKINKLKTGGFAPIYIRADAKDKKELEKAYTEIRKKYKKIHGIIHSAIILQDQSLAKMDEERFKNSLSVKVDISVRIAQVFKKESLDFVLFFSSMQSFTKLPGQSNYASGCTFKDAFARRLACEWKCDVKIINWGYWGSIGIVASQDYQQRGMQAGIGSIEPAEGMEALEKLLSGSLDQFGLLKLTKSGPIAGIADEFTEIIINDTDVTSSKLYNREFFKNIHLEEIKNDLSHKQLALEHLLGKLMFSLLQSMGCFKANFTDIITHAGKSGILEKYNRWMKASIDFLMKKSFIKKEADEYIVIKVVAETEQIWSEWEEAKKEWIKNQGMKSQVALCEAALKALPGILKGDIPATDVMFPDSSMKLVEGIYKNNDISDFFNDVLSNVILQYLKLKLKQSPEAKIRIFEIGSGTGGTSAPVFSKLEKYKDQIAEYCYTDVSQVFLMHGKKEYGTNSYLTFKSFDVSEPLSPQGIEYGLYDIVIGANVLHATKNIRQTIRNAKALLKKNGIILINEVADPSLFTHLTFGLLDGWWIYEDEKLRISGNPGLYPEIWKKVLEQEGFVSVHFPAHEARCLGQQIITGFSNGFVRQKQAEKDNVKTITKTAGDATAKKAELKHTRGRKEKFFDSKDPDGNTLKSMSLEYIKDLVGNTLKIPVNRINTSEPLEKYGIDSILIVQLTNTFRKIFDNVNSTTFFEYQNLDDLTDFLLRTKKEILVDITGYNKESIEKAKKVTKPSGKSNVKSGIKRINRLSLFHGSSTENTRNDDVAIIGVSGLYPQADTLYEFWENLKNKADCITEIPEDRWDWQQYFDAKKGKEGKIYTKWGGFINNYDTFDPLFFKISPKEAERMDPQERLFLQQAYASIEDAGYTPSTLSSHNDVGVFVGVMNGNYPMGANYWSMANRISYLFNYTGPSMAVDTACSSSLTAIHLACEHIRSGVISCAVAGGVNLVLSPTHYIRLSSLLMLSEGNKCKAFGNNADGFVDGEAVGSIILKSLSKAIEDGDHIYGIIKSSLINAGGKTNGYTVPNPVAQGELIHNAIKKAGISGRSISYIETHGTGTALGDPIEVTGLIRAFETETEDKQFCAIGSVKSNIGHTESAAGLAGLTKILLQMKYRKLLPSLHSEELNPEIRFADSPFFVQREYTDWESDTPRIAGLSSFGAGGANAHFIIQEYENNETGNSIPDSPVIIVLSAKNENSLKQRAADLLKAIEREGYKDENLEDMAYTLQIGREEMRYRLGFTALSMQEVKDIVTGFIHKTGTNNKMFTGEASDSPENLLEPDADKDVTETIISWFEKNKYGKFLELWVRGLAFDWLSLYDNKRKKPKRISLPTYPFLKERYWLKDIEIIKNINIKTVLKYHPLVHENTSTLEEQQYTSQFKGDEFFFTGRKLFSGAYLEMARTAIAYAASGMIDEMSIIRLKDVVLENIVYKNESIVLKTGLSPLNNGAIQYEIYTDADEVCGRGIGEIVKKEQRAGFLLNTIKDKIQKKIYSHDECSGVLKRLDASDAVCECVHTIAVGDGEALAHLSLPPASDQNMYVLHPSIIDAAVLVLRLLQENDGNKKGSFLQAIDTIEVFEGCKKSMWSYITKESDYGDTYTIDFYSEEGSICSRLCGIHMSDDPVVISGNHGEKSPVTREEPYTVMTFEEVWQEEDLHSDSGFENKTIVCFLTDDKKQREMNDALQNRGNTCQVIYIKQDSKETENNENIYTVSPEDPESYKRVFAAIREKNIPVDAVLYLWPLENNRYTYNYEPIVYLLKGAELSGIKPKHYILAGNSIKGIDECYLDSWIGFGKSIKLILPGTKIQCIFEDCENQPEKTGTDEWVQRIMKELSGTGDKSVFYKNGKRHVCSIRKSDVVAKEVIIKDNKTYVITGGCGGLGFLFAQHLSKNNNLNLVLTGRSPLDEEKKKKLQILHDSGSKALYFQADVSDTGQMKKMYANVKKQFGGIQGIIHAAGIRGTRNTILEKDIIDFRRVLEPKLQGSIVLDEIMEDTELDFVCYFSSAAGILGDFGTCDYAIGNRFQISYAHYRKRLQQKGLRKGKTIVINWPLWKDGGIDLGDIETNKLYLKSSGQRLLETGEGTDLFDKIISQDNVQHLVIAGQRNKVYTYLGLSESVAEKHRSTVTIQSGGRKKWMAGLSVEECIELDVKETISGLLKISGDRITKKDNLADFGFDSITLSQFADALGKYYALEITPATFFGYSTLEKLIDYFVTEHGNVMNSFYSEVNNQPVAIDKQSTQSRNVKHPDKRKAGKSRFALSRNQENNDLIAVIGISGRFPESRNIDEMWDILVQGKCAVTEYPKYPEKPYNSGTIGWNCGCVPGVGEFDPLFFEISPREAETMDPRQRLLLQESWKALEDAGYGTEKLQQSKIGMFVGTEQGNYHYLTGKEATLTSNHEGILAARLAYYLNFSGPVMAINTACSSSLVALHQACKSLLNKECDTALAAGVNLILIPEMFDVMNNSGMLSADGVCYAFDKRANGLVPGEAVAVVVLKTLSQAEADGDPVYAVIKGSGLNYDGKTNGITAPSGLAQKELIKTLYEKYNINPEKIDYVMAHGTGTRLGDPVEVNALTDVFKSYTTKQQFCFLSSSKPYFGHTFAASGIVSLISVILSLQHNIIPRSINFENKNDYINWNETPFIINLENQSWTPKKGETRLAAISSFGMSGTNAHIIVQDYTPEPDDTAYTEMPCYLLVFSAKTENVLYEKLTHMISFFKTKMKGKEELENVSYTLLEGRQHFKYRCAIVVQDIKNALDVLQKTLEKEKMKNIFYGTVAKDFDEQKAMITYINNLVHDCRNLCSNQMKFQETLYALADLYCQGYDIPWRDFYENKKPDGIHLPTYPFSKETYWVEKNGKNENNFSIKYIHPLLQENTSDLMEELW